jgi:aminoglycoside phosphotransferase (APT) family kinase protein
VPVIVHSDLHAGNIVDDGQLWLLDWEYAQVGDPLCDLAGLIAHHPPLGARREELLELAGLSGVATPAELEALAGVYRSINSLWQRCAWEL